MNRSISKKHSASSKHAANQIKPNLVFNFHGALESWYQANGRHELPWRNTENPYHIWLSEVMLQQTQVQTVLRKYYQPFLDRFPTIKALATADQEKVLKAWEGLGYYSRARNLHKAAAQLKDHHYQLPDHLEGLLALSGIGQNTAHAILAFAFHKPFPVMEANVKRVLMRIFALKTAEPKQLFTLADQLLNREHPFDYNQAMMDLGAMVCTVKAPECGACPAANICKGQKTPEAFPEKLTKKKVPTRQIAVLVRKDKQGKLSLEPRSDKLLGGLYGFAQLSEGEVMPKRAKHIGQVRHAYTHFKLCAEIYMVAAKKGDNDLYTIAQINALPLSKLDHKIVALLKAQQHI